MPDLVIKIDTNGGEDHLAKHVADGATSADVVRERLDIGDVRIEMPTGESVVIERKTWADLQSSLRDGRYKEQKARQMRAISEANGKLIMVYAVESKQVDGWSPESGKQPPAFGKHRAGVTTKHVDAAIAMTSVRDGIPVLRTANTRHTADLVLYLAKKLAAGELSGTSHAVMASAAGYAGFVKSTKKRANMDGGTTWQAMLSSITGVSAKKAKHVAEAYKTPAALCTALTKARDGKDRENLLASIQCDNNKRLGNALSKRIAETLCGLGS